MTTARRDEGSALIITLMVVMLVTVLATTALRVTVNDLSSASRAQQSAAALDAAEAGVAQALAYLRRGGTHALRCSPACAANAWGRSAGPAGYALPGGGDQSFTAWIEPVAEFPENDPGLYRVHATGAAANGVRSIEVDVAVGTRGTLPLGLFGRSIEGSGSYSLARASIFSTGCVWNRSHIDFTSEMDAAYRIPTGVHSSRTITDANGNGRDCAGVRKAIHASSPCDSAHPHDQDLLGGSLLSTGCSSTQTTHPRFYAPRDLDGDGDVDVNGSYLRDESALRTLFDIAPEPFTRAELDELRVLARQQGSYYRSTSFTTPNPAVHPNSVMFFDLLGTTSEGGIVDLKALDAALWGRAANVSADAAACKPQSLLIVIEGGNVRLNSGTRLVASVVLTSTAPYGQVLKHNGSAELVGTLYGDAVDLSGTGNLSLDQCFMSNLSPALLRGEVERYVEVDR